MIFQSIPEISTYPVDLRSTLGEDDPMSKANSVSDQLREAIRESGRSMLDVAREANLDKATMSRFLNGKRGLRMEAIDTLCAMLGLRLSKTRSAKKRGER